MTRINRLKLIKTIEKIRNSKLLVYITGDRQGLETRIGMDIFPIFHEHLIKLGPQEKIDIFLYSTGGIVIAGYALVNLIREFCEEFNVIIPFKALSCATLISLGANEVIMTPMAQLSPIDPSVHHPLGPQIQIPNQPFGQMVPVNVEDVNAFVGLAKKEIGLKNEQSMVKILELLGMKVNPLALGAIQRSREQITFLATNLLQYHLKSQDKISNIVQILTRERFSHDYIIGRKEAREILKLNIVQPDKKLLNLIMQLFNIYSELLQLNVPYNLEAYFLESKTNKITCDFNRAILESTVLTHVYKTKKEIMKIQIPPQPGQITPSIAYQEITIQEGWFRDSII